MSRYTIRLAIPVNDVVELAYGYDHAVGVFFQALNAEDDAVIDLDQLFNKLSGADVVEKIDEFGVGIPEIHKAALYMDMPF